MANTVKLTFAGDSTSLDKTFQKVGSGARDMAADLDKAGSDAKGFGSAVDGMNSKIGDSESKFMGAADLADGLGAAFGVNLGPTVDYARAFGDMAGGFESVVGPALSKLTAKLGFQTAATQTATGAQTGLNAAMRANPIGMVILALTALVAIFVVLYMKVDWFRNGVNAAFGAVLKTVQNVWGWVKNNWPVLLAVLTGPFGLAVLAISKNFDKIKGFVSSVRDHVKSVFSGLAGILTAPFRAAVDGFRSVWNSTIGGKGIPSIGIGPFKTPGFTIPMLANGGIVTGPTLAMIGEAGPEAVVPLNRAQGMGFGGGNQVIQVVLPGVGVIAQAVLGDLQQKKARGAQIGLA